MTMTGAFNLLLELGEVFFTSKKIFFFSYGIETCRTISDGIWVGWVTLSCDEYINHQHIVLLVFVVDSVLCSDPDLKIPICTFKHERPCVNNWSAPNWLTRCKILQPSTKLLNVLYFQEAVKKIFFERVRVILLAFSTVWFLSIV